MLPSLVRRRDGGAQQNSSLAGSSGYRCGRDNGESGEGGAGCRNEVEGWAGVRSEGEADQQAAISRLQAAVSEISQSSLTLREPTPSRAAGCF
jgi:hypothetical protein